MAEVSLVRFAHVALDVAKATVPRYRTCFSKHQFSQLQLLASPTAERSQMRGKLLGGDADRKKTDGVAAAREPLQRRSWVSPHGHSAFVSGPSVGGLYRVHRPLQGPSHFPNPLFLTVGTASHVPVLSSTATVSLSQQIWCFAWVFLSLGMTNGRRDKPPPISLTHHSPPTTRLGSMRPCREPWLRGPSGRQHSP